MSHTIDSQLRQVFESVLGVDGPALADESSPETIETWDSLNHVSLMMAIEADFSLQFEPTELMELRTYGAILRRVNMAVPLDRYP